MEPSMLEELAAMGRQELIDTQCESSAWLAASNFDELRLLLGSIEELIGSAETREASELAKRHGVTAGDGEFWAENYPYWWNQIISPQFRSSFVVSVMSALEFHLGNAVQNLGVVLDAPLSESDLKGRSVYDRAKKFISSFSKFTKPSARLWEQVADIQAVRNVIVHRSGIVDSAQQERRIHALAGRSPGLHIGSGHLEIKHEFCEFALEIAKQFTTEVFEELQRTCRSVGGKPN